MGNYSQNVRRNIYSVTGGKCFYCGCNLDVNNFQVDHYIAKSKNGIDTKNRVPACKDCNAIKSNKSIEEFRNTIEQYLTNDTHVLMIDKYMGITRKKVEFYFEEHDFTFF